MAGVRWGITGFGWVARDYVAPAIGEAGDLLAAIADPDPRAQADGRDLGAMSFPSLDALLVDGGIDALYVATPNHLHRAATEAAAAAGVAVLCEKPMAASLDDAGRMIEACRRAGVLYRTAFDQRHHPAHRAMRAAIEAGSVGTVTAVRILYACWLGADWTAGRGGDNWRIDPARAGGGALIDLAPHGIDLAGFLLGEPLITLSALLQRRVHPYPVDDGAMLMGRTESGALASLHVAYNYPEGLPRRRLEVSGTTGLLLATDTMGQDPGGTLVRVDGRTGASLPLPVPDATLSPFTAQIRSFSDALRRGDRDPSPGERDLAAMRLLAVAADHGQP